MATVPPEQGQVGDTGHGKSRPGCGLPSWAREVGGAGPQSWRAPPSTGPCEVTVIVHASPALCCHRPPSTGGQEEQTLPWTLAARASGASWLPPQLLGEGVGVDANAAPAGSTSPEEARASWWVSPPTLPQGDPTSAHLHLRCVTLMGFIESESRVPSVRDLEGFPGMSGCALGPRSQKVKKTGPKNAEACCQTMSNKNKTDELEISKLKGHHEKKGKESP